MGFQASTFRLAPRDVLGAPEPTFAVHADVLSAGEPGQRLKAHALSALMAVAPATFAWCMSLDRRHRSSQVITLQSGLTDFEAARRCYGQLTGGAAPDTFAAGRVQAYGATVLAVKDFEPECASAYREFLAKHGFGDRADVCLFNAGSLVAQFALVRAGGLS